MAKKSTPKDLSISFEVNKSRKEVMEAILNVRGWWSASIQGQSAKPGDEFRYQYQDLHVSRQKLIELIPEQKVTWLVSGSHLSFVKKTDEWDGTRITFELKDKGKKTEVHFIHEGLVPSFECFQACSDGWGYYVGESLRDLISKGKGKPDKSEKLKVKN